MAHIIPFEEKEPRVHPGAFVAPTAVLIGDVTVEEGASIWFGAVQPEDADHAVKHQDGGRECGASAQLDQCLPPAQGRVVERR